RVLSIERVIGHTRHHLGMCCLDQKGADPADHGGDVTDHLPADRPGAEQAGVTPVVEGVHEGVRRMTERTGSRGSHPLPEHLDEGHTLSLPPPYAYRQWSESPSVRSNH